MVEAPKHFILGLDETVGGMVGTMAGAKDPFVGVVSDSLQVEGISLLESRMPANDDDDDDDGKGTDEKSEN
jgi:hypothetical protein